MSYVITLIILNVAVAVITAIVLKQLGYWGSNKTSQKVQKDVKKEQSNFRQKQLVLRIFSKFEWLANNYGFLDTYELRKLDTYIQRLDMRIPVVHSPLSAKQLKGIFKALNILGLFIVTAGLLITGSVFSLLGLLFIFSNKVFTTIASMIIADRDKNIEDNFPDLYFSLYPYLTKGVEVRLTNGLREFLKARDTPRGKSEMKYLLIFVEDFLRLIDLYNDDIKALKELRNKYTFVTFVNFSNIAAQALDGIDNRDKLLNFRIELQRKNKARIEDNANKKVQWGVRSTYIIMAIMFQFIGIMVYLKFAIMGSM